MLPGVGTAAWQGLEPDPRPSDPDLPEAADNIASPKTTIADSAFEAMLSGCDGH
jgi:hypothetical protein